MVFVFYLAECVRPPQYSSVCGGERRLREQLRKPVFPAGSNANRPVRFLFGVLLMFLLVPVNVRCDLEAEAGHGPATRSPSSSCGNATYGQPAILAHLLNDVPH